MIWVVLVFSLLLLAGGVVLHVGAENGRLRGERDLQRLELATVRRRVAVLEYERSEFARLVGPQAVDFVERQAAGEFELEVTSEVATCP